MVWRRWDIRGDWEGNDYNLTNGLRNLLDEDGAGNFSGARSFEITTHLTAPGTSLELTRDLPTGQGFTNDRTGPRQDLLAIVSDGAGGWIQLTPGDRDDTYHAGLSLAIDTDPPSLILGSGREDATVLLGYLDGGADLRVTVGIRESAPLKVAWQRPRAQWPADLPRIVSVQRPQYEQWIALAGTITGVNASGALTTLASDVTVRDDVPALAAELALLRVWYGEPARTLSWRDVSQCDIAPDLRPGRLVTTATLGAGSTTINAVITRRTRTYTQDGFGTTYDTARMLPELEALR
jgi:hypothetical protein